MKVIEPHIHMIARTTQDYERMAMSGVVAVAEPAFWAGFDRCYPETFLDYFRLEQRPGPVRPIDTQKVEETEGKPREALPPMYWAG